MTITAANLGHLEQSTTQNFDTTSFSFVLNKLHLFVISGFLFSTDVNNLETINPPVVTGGTWDRVQFHAHAARNEFIDVYRHMPGSTSSHVVNFDVNPTGDSGLFVWAIDAIDGVDTSGTNGSGAITESGEADVDQGAAGPLAVTISGTPTPDAVWGAFGDNGGTGYAPGSGFTALAQEIAGTSRFLHTEWKNAVDLSIDYTWTSIDTAFQAIAVGLKAAVTFNPANLVVTPTPGTASLAWDASAGAIDYSVFRRTPQTGAAFVPGVDIPIASGITSLFYVDSVAPGDYDYQVFGRLT